MGITFDPAGRGGDGMITVTDYAEGAPCDFEALYQADVGGGWGVVSKQNDRQFTFTCGITIGDGSTETWFKDTKCQIMYTNCLLSLERFILVKNNARLELGTLVDEATKRTKYGVQILSYHNGHNHTPIYGASSNSHIYLYSVQYIHNDVSPGSGNGRFQLTSAGARVWNCMFTWGQIADTWTLDLYNTIFNTCYQAMLYVYSTGSTFDRVMCFDNSQGVVKFYAGDYTLTNMYCRGCGRMSYGIYKTSGNIYFIDCDTDNWDNSWPSTPSTCIVHRQYSFDLRVSDEEGNNISGATVTLADVDGNELFSLTTEADGTIATQIVTYCEYTKTTGSSNQYDTTTTLKSPFTIQITKGGYHIYSGEVTVDDTTCLEITLIDITVGSFDLTMEADSIIEMEMEDEYTMEVASGG